MVCPPTPALQLVIDCCVEMETASQYGVGPDPWEVPWHWGRGSQADVMCGDPVGHHTCRAVGPAWDAGIRARVLPRDTTMSGQGLGETEAWPRLWQLIAV